MQDRGMKSDERCGTWLPRQRTREKTYPSVLRGGTMSTFMIKMYTNQSTAGADDTTRG